MVYTTWLYYNHQNVDQDMSPARVRTHVYIRPETVGGGGGGEAEDGGREGELRGGEAALRGGEATVCRQNYIGHNYIKQQCIGHNYNARVWVCRYSN